MTMEIVKNNKGGSKLCFEGYTYTKKSANFHWECSQRKAYVCKGKVTTDSQVAKIIRTVEHSHDTNLEHIEATKIITSMKESAGTRRAKPAQLYADHTKYATAHIRAEIGHQDPRTHPLGSPQRQDSNPLGSTWSSTSEASTKSHQTTTRYTLLSVPGIL